MNNEANMTATLQADGTYFIQNADGFTVMRNATDAYLDWMFERQLVEWEAEMNEEPIY